MSAIKIDYEIIRCKQRLDEIRSNLDTTFNKVNDEILKCSKNLVDSNNTNPLVDPIQKLLEQDNTYEAGAIMLGGTNHNILNTYGWVKLSDLKESTRGTENLKDFVITTGNDNTEILQQLQQEQEGTER